MQVTLGPLLSPDDIWELYSGITSPEEIAARNGLTVQVTKDGYVFTHPIACKHTVTPNPGKTQLDDGSKLRTGASNGIAQVDSEA